MAERSGWSGVFIVVAVLDLVAATMAILVLERVWNRAVNEEPIPNALGISRV